MQKVIDGFRFVPPALRSWLTQEIPTGPFTGSIPWTELKRPLKELTFSLMTSAGINVKSDPPFDMEREKREPMWGDPTCREVPKDVTETDIDVNHLHINTSYIKQDINVMLPVKRFKEFEEEGIIGRLAPTCYSYYGFQLDASELLEKALPRVAAKMSEEGVEAVLLTPA